jgi:hypothetical protein
MKLVTYGYRGERRAGIVEGDWVIDVARAHAQRAGDGPAAERAAPRWCPRTHAGSSRAVPRPGPRSTP